MVERTSENTDQEDNSDLGKDVSTIVIRRVNRGLVSGKPNPDL